MRAVDFHPSNSNKDIFPANEKAPAVTEEQL